jgi:acyl dehydratase
MLDYAATRNRDFPDAIQTYGARDTILYALGLGYGADPLDEQELRFVYEGTLTSVPTQVAVLGSPGFFWQDPSLGVDWVKIVHGEQDVRWFRPLPPAATIVGRNRIAGLTDKGPGKGVIAQVVRDIIDQASGERIAEVRQVTVLRGNGGYSLDNGQSDPPPATLPPIGDELGAPHRTVVLATLPQAALIYRLSGDYNPLHADPATARAAGFDRPILHGLCTYGMTARALLGAYLDHDATRLRRLAVRFTAPVFPGETLTFELWQRSETQIAIRATVAARDVTVLNHGIAEIAPIG